MEQRATSAGIEVQPTGLAIDATELRGLYRELRKLAGVVADADMDPEDLVHDALVGLLRTPPGSVRDVPAYLRRSVVNAASRERGRRARLHHTRARVAGEQASATTEHYPSHVVALLEALTPVDRALLYLVDVEGAPVAEAADAVGLTVLATRARISRARRRALRSLPGEVR